MVTANPQTALELTDNMPVGTYVLLSPLEGPQRFTFLCKRWLEMTRLDPAKVMTDITSRKQAETKLESARARERKSE